MGWAQEWWGRMGVRDEPVGMSGRVLVHGYLSITKIIIYTYEGQDLEVVGNGGKCSVFRSLFAQHT